MSIETPCPLTLLTLGATTEIWLRIWTEHGTTSHAEAYFGTYLGFGVICTLFSGACV